MRKKLLRLLVLMLAVALSTAACSKGRNDEKTSGQSQTFNPVAINREAPPKAVGNPPDGTMKVVLLPAHPTVVDRLQALVQNGRGSLDFSWDVDGTTVSGENAAILPADMARKGDRVTVQVTAGDKTLSAETTVVDSPPKITALKFQDAHVHRGKEIAILPQASDPDGDEITFHYHWTLNGEELDNDSSHLPGDAFHRGDKIAVQVIPGDGEKEGTAYQSAAFTVPDAPPVFDTTPPQKFRGREYRYTAHATDPDGDKVTYALETAPAGMTIDPESGQIQWPITANAAGTHRIAITASDPEGLKAVQEYNFVLNTSN